MKHIKIMADIGTVQTIETGGYIMKRIISMLVIIGIILGISACGKKPITQEETTITTESVSQTLNTDNQTVDESETQAEETEKTTVLETAVSNATGDGVIEVKYYRDNYYSVAAPFVYLVGKEVYREWKGKQPDPDETNVMLMVNFIRDFNISREDFNKANLEYAWRIKYLLNGTPVMNPKDFANQEDEEVYNADIIYTFNNELINEYYLTPDYPYLFEDEYKEAVANGTYQTQTIDFIEVPEERPWPESSNRKINDMTENETTIPEQTEAITTE